MSCGWFGDGWYWGKMQRVVEDGTLSLPKRPSMRRLMPAPASSTMFWASPTGFTAADA